MIPPNLLSEVLQIVTHQEGHSVELLESRKASGGCINSGAHLAFSNGLRLFLKFNPTAPPDLFTREAEGLEWLRSAASIRLPKVYHVTAPSAPNQFLLLEDVLTSAGKKSHSSSLALGLAGVHKTTAPQFGLGSDNYLGPTHQPNNLSEDWPGFFIERRLTYMIDLMEKRGFSHDDTKSFREFLPKAHQILSDRQTEPPSLVHGDLWGGNALHTPAGEPVLIDPAVYFGDREVDLAMTRLFGGFPAKFYSQYQEAYPLADGWRERQDIYNLYHILHHALLFGGGYLTQARQIARSFM